MRHTSHGKIVSYAGLSVKICLKYAINMCCNIQIIFYLPSDRFQSRFNDQICVKAAVKGKLAVVGYTAFPAETQTKRVHCSSVIQVTESRSLEWKLPMCTPFLERDWERETTVCVCYGSVLVRYSWKQNTVGPKASMITRTPHNCHQHRFVF